MTPKHKFAEGEKVLCFHGPLIYEAKALKSTITKDKQIKYYIHYAGWNKNWDEWVPENRVLKYNEANVQRQKEVYKLHSNSAGKNKKGTPKGKKGEATIGTASKDGTASGSSESRASTPSKELNTTPLAAPSTTGRANRTKPATSTPIAKDSDAGTVTKEETGATIVANKDDAAKDEPPKKKRGGSTSNASDKSNCSAAGTSTNVTSTPATTASTSITPAASHTRLDTCVESEETFLSKVEVKIKIPDELKQCLADDWDAITRQHKLLDIPAKITVQDIVDQYIAFKKTSKSTNASKEVAINDVLNGVVEYFNVMLGSQLLYKFERPQYAEILQQHPETSLSKLYGGFHLLRLFVKLGSMLGFSALDEKSMQMLLVHLHDFLKFLVKNSATYFSMTNFVNVSPEYHRNTQ
ncbi:PREDICTED: LOW QUALITY PROTEIN: nuA4 complex subunit EAF3 homolog [Rhagoletis zephyria]|uniref:LOW QUALITY PROTEIN: nuA4 complex subunit EAF3 homolog n=2 Tax=Rhagoletis zephyria TaxID=28612 RepID=UPI0008119067|nr:PREDICTED: LOW QUALITY PROTEIN: nuA4 complex subunit EAF3 homolog [Rhagoletis zephyria]